MSLFTVGILGRPNVGKSSLFNKLFGRRRAIVLDQPGTTLDFIVETLDWGKGAFILIDTQGTVEQPVHLFRRSPVDDADVYLLVVDARVGLSPYDQQLQAWLRDKKRPVLLCVNKSEGSAAGNASEFAPLGFESEEISAEHNLGIDRVKEWITSEHDKKSVTDPPLVTPELNVAIVGRPNAGKSTLMNHLSGKKVSRVSPIALTTRDSVHHEIDYSGTRIRLLDTAGLRRKARTRNRIEVLSSVVARRAMDSADIILHILDARESISDQDKRLLSLGTESGKPVLLLFNFWDQLGSSMRKKMLDDSRIELRGLSKEYRILPISAKTGFNCDRILREVLALHNFSKKRIATSDLNRLVSKILAKNPPPAGGSGRFNILYASQVQSKPPTFVFFVNRRERIPEFYRQYLKNQLRSQLRLASQPIRLLFRAKS